MWGSTVLGGLDKGFHCFRGYIIVLEGFIQSLHKA